MSKQAEHRKKRREMGMCVREGCPVFSGDAHRCPDHAQEHSEAMLRWRQEHGDEIARRRQVRRAKRVRLFASEAAKILGCSPWRVKRMVQSGVLSAIRTGRRILIEKQSVEALLSAARSVQAGAGGSDGQAA